MTVQVRFSTSHISSSDAKNAPPVFVTCFIAVTVTTTEKPLTEAHHVGHGQLGSLELYAATPLMPHWPSQSVVVMLAMLARVAAFLAKTVSSNVLKSPWQPTNE